MKGARVALLAVGLIIAVPAMAEVEGPWRAAWYYGSPKRIDVLLPAGHYLPIEVANEPGLIVTFQPAKEADVDMRDLYVRGFRVKLLSDAEFGDLSQGRPPPGHATWVEGGLTCGTCGPRVHFVVDGTYATSDAHLKGSVVVRRAFAMQWDLGEEYFDAYGYVPTFERSARNPMWNPSDFVTYEDPVVRSLAVTVMQTFPANQVDSDLERANFVLAFLDAVDYKYDQATAGKDDYTYFPTETLYRRQGDCEDQAILYAALAGALGLEVVLFTLHMNETTGHVAAGVHLASPPAEQADYYLYDGKPFYFVEATANLGVGVNPWLPSDGYARFPDMMLARVDPVDGSPYDSAIEGGDSMTWLASFVKRGASTAGSLAWDAKWWILGGAALVLLGRR